MQIENIRKFLETAYSDEKLSALLAHAQDGKLSYRSCCCLVGFISANHPLKQKGEFVVEEHFSHPLDSARHYSREAWAISDAFCHLGKDDDERRERLIPLILVEMARRESLRNQEQGPNDDDECDADGGIFGTGDPYEMEHSQHGRGCR